MPIYLFELLTGWLKLFAKDFYEKYYEFLLLEGVVI